MINCAAGGGGYAGDEKDMLSSIYEGHGQSGRALAFCHGGAGVDALRAAPVAVHFAEACRTLGIEPKFGSTFGGSDGNTMMQHGIPCAVLSCGMYDVHSVREYAKVGDIVNGARLIAELITQGQEASIE